MKALVFAAIMVIVALGGSVTTDAYGCPEAPISIVIANTDTVGIYLTSLTTIEILAHDTVNGVSAAIAPGTGYDVVSQPAKKAGLFLPGTTGSFTGTFRITRTGTTIVTIEASGVGQDGRQIMSNYRLVVAVSDTSAASYSISEYIDLFGVSGQSLTTSGMETIIYTSGTAMAEPLGADSTWSDDLAKSANGTFAVRGYLFYHDPVDSAGVLRPAVNVAVEIWDSDNWPNSDDRLGATITNWSGYFEKSGLDNGDGLGGSADPYLRYKTKNSKWGVASILTGEYYWWYSYRSFSGVGSGSILDFGRDYIPERSVAEGAMWIHQFVNLAWAAVASSPVNDDPGTVTVGWPKAESGNYYDTYSDGIFMHQNDADAIDIVNHEYGHFLMDHAYDHNYLNTNCPSPHYLKKVSNETCAWSEGWATFFTQVVVHDGTRDYEAYGSSVELEHEVYGWDWGPSCEGRVARALLDLWDTNNDYDDQNSAYPVSFYDIYGRGLHSARDNTFRDFWDRTKGNIISYPEAYCGVRSIANNTIQFVGAMRGDCNADNAVDVSDLVYLIARIFSGGGRQFHIPLLATLIAIIL